MKKFLVFITLTILIFSVPFKIQALNNIDYESIFEQHNSIMLIIDAETGIIHHANPAAVDFYGYPKDTLIGMSISEINTLSEEEIYAERQKALREERNFFIFNHRLSNGEIKTVHVHSYPIEIDGHTFLVSIVIDQTAFITIQRRNEVLITGIISLLILSAIITSILFLDVKIKNRKLRESNHQVLEEERMKTTLISNLPGVAYRCLDDLNWTMLFMSDKAFELFHHRPCDFINGKVIYNELIHPDDRENVRRAFASGLSSNTGVNLTYRLLLDDNKTHWVQEIAHYIGQKNEDGHEIIEGFIQDITDKKEADLSATYFKNFLDYTISNSNQAIAVHDRDMKYIYVSDKYLKDYRVTKTDIIGKHHYDIFPDIPQKWRKVHQRCLRGEVLSGDRDLFIREDGSKDYTRWLCRPWYDDQGQIGGIIVYTEVINDLIQAELKAQETTEKLQLVMDNLPIGIAIHSIDPEVDFTYMNDDFPKIYHTTKDALKLPGSFWSAVYEDEIQRNSIRAQVLKDLKSMNKEQMKWQDVPLTKHGKVVAYISAQNTPIPNSNLFISTVIDVTDRKMKENEIIYTSNHDYLTGLPNRRYFEETIAMMDSKENFPLAILMADLDGLKIINDAFGHEQGDTALLSVAKTLRQFKMDQDFVARIGGDEFILLRPNTHVDEIKNLKQQIVDFASQVEIKELKLSLSIGYDIKTNEDMSILNVLKEAEDEMYRNKVLHGQSARNESVMSIFNTLKDKYEDERIHSDNVSKYCLLIGDELGLNADELKELEIAGLMHDIGKITIPDSILHKPGKLNAEEWRTMKNHTINGYNILKSADKYSKLAEYALTHHERWDGMGYPNGLKEDEIPLYSRIISIADSFEAMTADRPYRKALSKDYAIDELIRCSGSQFDPKLVNIFIKTIS